MSPLLLSSYGRKRIRPAAPPGFVSLAAVYRTWGTPTDDTARFTIPLAPNHGYTTDDVRVFVGGTERAIHIEELRGRHNNGSGGDGGARAFFVELDATGFVDDTAAEIRLGDGVRVPADLSATGRGSMAMLKTHFENPRVVLCTDADYLCASWVTFHPMVPETSIQADEQDWAITNRTTWQTTISNPSTGGSSNNYDGAWAALGWWCQSGDPDDWYYANLAMRFLFTYSTPTISGTTSGGIHLNPESIAGSLEWQANETLSLFCRELASCYLAMGYGQLWRNLVQQHSQTFQSTNWTAAGFLSRIIGSGGGRFNMGRNVTPALYGSLVDATYVPPTGTFAGGYARRVADYPTDLPVILDAFDDAKQTAASGAYRENFRGYRDTTLPEELGNYPLSVGDWEQFQGAVPTLVMIDYYLNVQADSRLPGWVKTNVTAMLTNMVNDSGTYNVHYLSTRFPGAWRGDIAPTFGSGGGSWYRVPAGSGVAAGATATTVTLPLGTPFLTDDYYNGMTIVVYGSTSGGYAARETFTILDYVGSTRVVTIDGTFAATPTGQIVYGVFSTDSADQTAQTRGFSNAADWMRALQFCAALFPSDTANGRTFEQWRQTFAAQAANIGENNRSIIGRWFNTLGCAFTVNGVPAGPSAIREPVVWESA